MHFLNRWKGLNYKEVFTKRDKRRQNYKIILFFSETLERKEEELNTFNVLFLFIKGENEWVLMGNLISDVIVKDSNHQTLID